MSPKNIPGIAALGFRAVAAFSAAVVGLIALIAAPARADYVYPVRTAADLANAASSIKAQTTRDKHVVQFDASGNLGTFKLDGAGANIDTLVFTRKFSDSAGVLRFDSTLFDIKRMTAPVVLRGLAFMPLNRNATLISGAETNKENRVLIIDSCFFYSDDSLQNTFINWLSDASGSIEIRRSFFVSKPGKGSATHITLTAPTVTLSNNLFNFDGSIITQVTGNVTVTSNTFNRTQMRLIGDGVGTITPKFAFTRNLFANPPAVDAFGNVTPYVIYPLNFSPVDSYARFNRMYRTWAGFDYPGNTYWSQDTTTNKTIDPSAAGVAAGELWNWYTDAYDPLTGLQSGDGMRATKYNVFPSDTGFSWNTGRGRLRVHFQAVPYPRQIYLDTMSDSLPKLVNRSLRAVSPSSGPLHFGRFEVDHIVLHSRAAYGRPVALAKGASGYATQGYTGNYGDTASFFGVPTAGARYFVLADSGNTAAGDSVTPTSVLSASDALIFSHVDSAGQSAVTDPQQNLVIGNEYRFLGRNFGIATTAYIKGGPMIFGCAAPSAPYSSDSVFWYVPGASPDSVYHAASPASGPNAGKFLSTINFSATAVGSTAKLSAFLVERLGVPRGSKLIPIPGGVLSSNSASGYQIKIDSTLPVDTVDFGSTSKGYRFFWPHRGPTDDLILQLKAKPGQDLYVTAAGNAVKLDAKRSSDTLSYATVAADSAKVFFLALQYNIIRNVAFSGTIDSVSVANLQSATSGTLHFGSLPDNTVGNDTNFANTKLLGGKIIQSAGVTPAANYGLTFPTAKPLDSTKVEAWYYDGTVWQKIGGGGYVSDSTFGIGSVPVNAQMVAVVERFLAPENYLNATPNVVPADSGRPGRLTITPVWINANNQRITSYSVDVRYVDVSGAVVTEEHPQKAIADSTQAVLQATNAYMYRVRYYINGVEILGRTFNVLANASWSPKTVMPDGFGQHDKYQWYMLGFHSTGHYKDILKKIPKTLSDSAVDTIDARGLVYNKGGLAWDMMTPARFDTLTCQPGSALLFSSTWDISEALADTTTFPTLGKVIKSVDSGWSFIANPFPIDMAVKKISSIPPQPLVFQTLKPSAPDTGGKHTYTWDSTPSLQRFHGYAFYSPTQVQLVFDPFADIATATPSPAGKGAGANTSANASAGAADDGRFTLGLKTPWGSSSMALASGSTARSIPFLPAPGGAPQLRVGGGSGYFIKRVADLAAVDEPVQILSGQSGVGSFGLATADASVRMSLIDLSTGKIYDAAAAQDMPVFAGAHAYRLLAGSAAFVASRAQAFLKDAPGALALGQNFPNPVRGLTRIAVDWPAWGGERAAVLDVIDLRGRIVHRAPLTGLHVGRQTVDLDASKWSPGLYLYRLTVLGGNDVLKLEKRMLVAP